MNNLQCNKCGGIELSKTSLLYHICDKERAAEYLYKKMLSIPVADYATDGDELIRRDTALEMLRWVLSATTEDVEQWRNGEEAARFVADLERKSNGPNTSQMPEQCRMLGY